MATTIKALTLQTFLDISIIATGNVFNAFDISLANDRSITDDLQPGEMIVIPDGLIMSNKELQYFKARNIVPATGVKASEAPDETEDYLLPSEFPISF